MTDLKSNGLSKNALRESLSMDFLHFNTIPSTSTYLKELAASGKISSPLAVFADTQSGGRGRLGRSFFSDASTGLYMSILLFPKCKPSDSGNITTVAALALCRAIDTLTGIRTDIKWVNDVYLNGRKIAGILTEGGIDPEKGSLSYAVLGIGVNVFAPEGGFPEDIKNIASSLFSKTYLEAFGKYPFFRERLAGQIIKEFTSLAGAISDASHFDEYKSRMFLIGQELDVIKTDLPPESAKVVDLLPDFSLLVEYPSGKREFLISGEVSLKIK